MTKTIDLFLKLPSSGLCLLNYILVFFLKHIKLQFRYMLALKLLLQELHFKSHKILSLKLA
jgi:hypothetical protein